MNFEAALRANLDKLGPFQRARANHILSLPASSPRRARMLAWMEEEATAHLGAEQGTISDWTQGAVNGATTIDWPTLLKMLAQLLPIILAFFGA